MQRISRLRYTDDFKVRALAPAEAIDRAKAARQLDVSVKIRGHAGRFACRSPVQFAQPSAGQ